VRMASYSIIVTSDATREMPVTSRSGVV